MKKLNTIILSSKNEKLITSLNKKLNKKLILINSEIKKLEKIKKNNQNIKIYPINFKEDNYEKEKTLFQKLIITFSKKINLLIIETNEPKYAQPFENINLNEFTKALNNDIKNTIKLLQNIIKIEKEIKIIIILHREKKYKKCFFIPQNCINTFIIELMKNINENNKNITVNCISTENLNLEYKQNIYPFKKKNNLKEIDVIVNACILINKINIQNKIIIL
jgi:hypothetical protein